MLILNFLRSAVQLHSGLNKRLENKLSTHHDEIFKSVDSYLDDIKKGEEQLKDNIAHPNIILYVVISACVLGLLFFMLKCPKRWIQPGNVLTPFAGRNTQQTFPPKPKPKFAWNWSHLKLKLLLMWCFT